LCTVQLEVAPSPPTYIVPVVVRGVIGFGGRDS
jgi:hypothetical protein